MVGDRRMEAENYLSYGYGVRLAIESRAKGWVRLSNLAHVWQPSRLKGIQVGPRVRDAIPRSNTGIRRAPSATEVACPGPDASRKRAVR